MLGMLTSLAKAALSVVTVPVAVVADVVTLGGVLDKRRTYTDEAAWVRFVRQAKRPAAAA